MLRNDFHNRLNRTTNQPNCDENLIVILVELFASYLRSDEQLTQSVENVERDMGFHVDTIALLERRPEIKHNNCLNMFSLRLCI